MAKISRQRQSETLSIQNGKHDGSEHDGDGRETVLISSDPVKLNVIELEAGAQTAEQTRDADIEENTSLRQALALAHNRMKEMESREQARIDEEQAAPERLLKQASVLANIPVKPEKTSFASRFKESGVQPAEAAAPVSQINQDATRFFVETLYDKLSSHQRLELDAVLSQEWGVPAGTMKPPQQGASLGALVTTLLGSLSSRTIYSHSTMLAAAIGTIKSDTFPFARNGDELNYFSRARLTELADVISEQWSNPLRRAAKDSAAQATGSWSKRHAEKGNEKETARS